MRSNKGMSMFMQSLFAIFMVIFVFLVLFTVLQKRTTNLQTEQEYDFDAETNNVLLAVLSNPNCISVGERLSSNTSTAVQGLLDSRKLSALANENRDMWCVENFHFIYSLEIIDDSSNTWMLGPIDINPSVVDTEKRVTLPSAVRFENGIVHSATVSITAYDGSVPRFYGAIKEACVLKEDRVFSLDTEKEIKYFQKNNTLHIGDDYFYPYFSCAVLNFTMPRGRNVVYMNYQAGKLEVRT